MTVQLIKKRVQRGMGLELLLGCVNNAYFVEDLNIGNLSGGDGNAPVAGLNLQNRFGAASLTSKAAVHGLPHCGLC